MRDLSFFLLAAFLTAPATVGFAAEAQQGIVGQPAPSWGVDEWSNLPAGKIGLDVGDYRGKVLYLYCFQSWCPGCHHHGFPTLQKMISRHKGNDGVAFVAVQTVFEGYASNTFKHAKKVARDYGLKIPIGQSGERGKPSSLMRRYRTGGTPWTVIVDRDGVIRFNDFQVSVQQASRLIDRLLQPEAGRIPPSQEAEELVGRPLDLAGLRWINTPDRKAVVLAEKVTLIRWWTDTCPYCAASLPAIAGLEREFSKRGFQTIAVYHPKPPRAVEDADVLATARRLNYTGPLAVDIDWGVLGRNYLSRHSNVPTSVSFLLDRRGHVRFVHAGPVLAADTDPEIQQGYEDMRTAIEILLQE